ncbi:MAG: non-homologous end-joining DNA ligase [Rhodothermales bacterium]
MSDTMPIDANTVALSNPDKLFFPDDGITKGDLIAYYRRIAPRMLPYLDGRPLTLHRFPNGIAEGGFIQQQASAYFPDWITRVTVPKTAGTITHVVADSPATLVYLANQGVITLHAWLSRVDKPRHPDRLIFDLDPPGKSGAGGFDRVRAAARAVRTLLDELELPAYLMTTGSRGLHVVTPLDRSADFEAVRAFARDLAQRVAGRFPDELTVEQRKNKRKGRVFIDTLRNAYGQTAVAPFAVRALPKAPVATPLHWDELDDADLHPQRYTIRNLFGRIERGPDPWAGMARAACSIDRAARRLAERGE